MSVLRKRQKGRLDRRRSLAGVPVLHDGVQVHQDTGGIITLKTRVERGIGFLERFRPRVTEKRYELDEFGTFVVRQIQKRRNVLDIICVFERRFGMSHRESELGVVAFVKMLMKRNVLSVVIE